MILNLDGSGLQYSPLRGLKMRSPVLLSKSDPDKAEPCQSGARRVLDQEFRPRPQSTRLSHFFFPSRTAQQRGVCAYRPTCVRLADQKTKIGRASCRERV